jgi:hypothetical protein
MAKKKTETASITRRSYLTKGEEAALWHKLRDSPGLAIGARDRQAVQEGKKVEIQVRQEKPKSE